MNNHSIKMLSIFIVSIFLLSTIAIIALPTFTNEENIFIQNNNKNTSNISTISGGKGNTVDTNTQQLLGDMNSINHDSSVIPKINSPNINPTKSAFLPNILSYQPVDKIVNPVLDNINSQNPSMMTGVQALTTSGQRSSTFNPQTMTYIEQWSDLIQNNTLGIQNLKTQYPSNLLVKINTNNNIEFVVKVKSMSDVSVLNPLFSTYNINIESQVSSLGALVVWVPSNNLNSFLQETTNYGDIAYVEPNGYVHVQYVPNDPYWSNQYAPQLIGMPTAWDQELGSRSVKVAVIDTGIDYTHPDLINNYLPIGYNWIYNNSNPMDDNGHGTHVAGTIAAAINNGIGIAGIANVSIFAEKFLDSNGYGSDVNAALAINHAVAMGANILSNSWGGSFNSSLIADAVANAISKGVMVVAAAGNSDSNLPFYPVDLPGVVGVAATDSSDNRASFSNYGNYVDISAPGVGIYSTYLNNSYAYLSGTSMATPHVSGLAALLMSKYPSDNATQIEDIIYNTAVDLGTPGWDPYYGWGRIDAGSAIFGLQPHNVRASLNTPSVFPVGLNSTFNASIRNIGLNTEFNITYTMFENGTKINNGTVPVLTASTTINIPVSILPVTVGTYNLTLVVNPVPGENVTADNVAIKLVQAVTKQINMNVGDILAYNNYISSNATGSTFPFDFAFNVTAEVNPTTYNVSYLLFILNASQPQQITLLTFLVNPYTREMTNGPWGLFPYWINTTGLKINDTVDLFTNGGHEGTVVGNSTYNYYGTLIPTVIINDSYELVAFDKDTGVLLADYNLNSTFPPYFITSYNNIHPQGFNLHNLKGKVGNVYSSPGITTQIYFLVINTGSYFEVSNVTLYLNNTFMVLYNFNLGPGQYQFFTNSWTPTVTGSFPINLIVNPVINETYLADNYANATAFSILTYIVIHVFNGSTYQVISGAQVDVYNYYNGSLVDSGYTNTNGTYQTKNLVPSYYYIQVTAAGYYNQIEYIFINPPGGTYDVYFYLTPLPQRSAQIVSPFNGSTIQGGLVNINYTASDISSIQSINIYVNTKYIGATYLYFSSVNNNTGSLLVPVFGNGTNTIVLNFVWYDSSTANATVTINSINVVPIFHPKPGDFLNYRIDLNFGGGTNSSSFLLANFTFGNWISPTEINVTYRFNNYLPNGTSPYPVNITWFPVNILNGFIDSSSFISQGSLFYFLSNLGFTNPNGHGSLGDKVPFGTWSDILIVNGMSTWNGINVWTLTDNIAGDSFYISRLTGVLVDAKLYNGLEELHLVSTSFPLSAPAPTVSGPSEIIYELDTRGHTINWSISGTYPDIYTIMRNGSILVTGKWISGTTIIQNIDGLAHGIYIYTFTAYNVGGWYTNTSVLVRVIDIPRLSSPTDITYTIGHFGAKIIWNATDSDPNTYSITRNNSFVNSGSWRTGVNIAIAVDVLPIGTFNYTILVTDLEGYNATDSVLVYVLPTASKVSPGFDILLLISAFVTIATISLYSKKKNKLQK